MAAIYGLDLQGLFDLPDPEITCSEVTAAAYACARRWMTPSGALVEIGEVQQYDSIDVREWLGQRPGLSDPTVINDLQAQATQVLFDEQFVSGASVTVTFIAGLLTITAQIQGALGPFAVVLQTNGVTAQLLLPGQT